jgi:hypothetical protein
MYIKSEAVAQKENKQERSRKEQVPKTIQFGVKVGDQIKCPECETIGRVVYVSQDKKKMGVQCPASHSGMKKVWSSKFGETFVPSGKTRKDVVFLTATG